MKKDELGSFDLSDRDHSRHDHRLYNIKRVSKDTLFKHYNSNRSKSLATCFG